MFRFLSITALALACATGPGPSTSDSGTPPAGPCASSTPLTVPIGGVEVETGFERCDDTSNIHRASAIETGPAPVGACTSSEVDYDCETDADCTDAAHGRCGGPVCNDVDLCLCQYGCVADSDCGADEYCEVLDRDNNRCLPAGCHTDADCSAGELCRRALNREATALHSEPYTLQCTSPDDSCDEMDPQLCGWMGERFVVVGESTYTCE